MPHRRASNTTQFAWGLIDQGLSSATNFAASVLAARQLSNTDFGVFSIGFASYLVFLGVSRAWGSNPLQIRTSADVSPNRDTAIQMAAGSAISVGIIAALILSAFAAALGGQLGRILIAVAIFLPGLMLQDLWRYAFVMSGRARAAAINDGVWLFTTIALFKFSPIHDITATASFSYWAIGANFSAIIGHYQFKLRPRLQPIVWWKQHTDIGLPFTGDFIITTGIGYVLTFGVAGSGGLSEAAGFRGAQVLMGPLNIIFLSASMQVVPIMVRQHHASVRQLTRVVIATSTALLAAASLWGVLAAFIPDSVGVQLMGDTWDQTSTLLVVLAIGFIARAIGAGPRLGLSAVGDATRLLKVRVALAPVVILLGGGGSLLAGSFGAATGLTIASAASAPIWWWAYRRSIT